MVMVMVEGANVLGSTLSFFPEIEKSSSESVSETPQEGEDVPDCVDDSSMLI
jgi:hypothetical protein